MNQKVFMVLCGIVGSALVSGCAPRIGGSNYAIGGVGEVSHTTFGTIVSKRDVKISSKSDANDNKPGAGALGGAVLGGALAGSTLGGGNARLVTGAAGALAGAFAGHFIEQAMTDQTGVEYTVRLETGRTITIAQGADPVMSVGQRVAIIESHKGERSRIVPA